MQNNVPDTRLEDQKSALIMLVEGANTILNNIDNTQYHIDEVGEFKFGKLIVQVQTLRFEGEKINNTFFLMFNLKGVLDMSELANVPATYVQQVTNLIESLKSQKGGDFKPRIVLLSNFTENQFGANIWALKKNRVDSAVKELEAIQEYILSIAIVPEGFRAEAFKQFIDKLVNPWAKKPTQVYHIKSDREPLINKVVELVASHEG
jgi:hypothetical protein